MIEVYKVTEGFEKGDFRFIKYLKIRVMVNVIKFLGLVYYCIYW